MNKIRIMVLAAAVAGLGVACSQDPDKLVARAGQAPAGPQAGADMANGAATPVHDPAMAGVGAVDASALRPGTRPGPGFARLQDRGDFVAYPRERVVRRAGPHTWHRADVSEAHALQAMASGVLTLTAPSGELLKFQYERHVEHASGDWTWIGRVLGGTGAQDAILTFGREAVFGTIAQATGAPLRLTMKDGASWLVETDVAARALQSEQSGRYSSPDFLLPPEPDLVEGLGVRAEAQGVGSAEALTSAAKRVDVLVGYTGGFVNENGGASSALTRINFLVAHTNEAYLNSQVDARVRLVHSMQVQYTDANDNSDALEALTGSDGSFTPEPDQVDPALKPLHQARDQYGADLVVLLRGFQDPEHTSCGVAWLIGGGLTPTHTGYSVFGMAVVSDGNDGNFFCDDTTFAHELGHNMGLAHDVDTAMGDDGVLQNDEYGRFEYSFGYRTPADLGSFTTIMAYGDDHSTSYNVFSNPDITACGGFSCGVEGAADNARTLPDTLAVVVGFRSTVVPDEPPQPVAYTRDDIEGDGDSDLTWRNNTETRFAYWLLDGASVVDAMTFSVSSAWSVVAKGDLNGDGVADLVWSNGTVLYLWAGNGSGGFASHRIGGVPNGWRVVDAGDIDGDLKDDLVWRNDARTRVAYWIMDGATRVSSSVFSAGSTWELEIVDDLSGDGKVDLVWTNGSRLVLWTSTGAGFDAASIRSHPSGWALVDSGDLDGDGDADLHWRSNAREHYAYWLMDGATLVDGHTWRVGPAWTLATVGDYNGDGYADLTWTSSTRVVQWTGNGQGSFASANVRSYPTGWTLLR